VDVTQIEQKLSRRPHSPLFARLADDYLRAGMAEPAKELLLSGLEKYPSYPAAHLVLARCYAAEEDYPSALTHLRISVSAIPAVDHLLELAEAWEAKMRPAPGPEDLPELPGDLSSVAEPADDVAALPAEVSPAIATVTTEEPAATEPPPAPVQVHVMTRPKPARTHSSGRIEDGRIVSKTLAEIYAMQGEYGEAIITYTMLKHHRPQMAAECDLRISELEQALQAKLNQQKLAVSK
jgi:tetratricopeptide (TPR) repeat protein